MFHVLRNTQGVIETVSREHRPGCELLPEDHPEIRQFFAPHVKDPEFNAADADFVRVIEDLIDTLIMKNVIRHTDLPAAAQKKLMLRKGLRNRMQGALNLLGGDDRIL
jgi:hypothetical protein